MAIRASILLVSLLATLTAASPTPTTTEIDERALGPNLINDPGFEKNGSWRFVNPGATRQTGAGPASGKAYAQLSWSGHDMAPGITNNISPQLTKTGNYTFQFDYAVTKNLAPGKPRDCYLQFSTTFNVYYPQFKLQRLVSDKKYKSASTVVYFNEEAIKGEPDVTMYCKPQEGGLVVQLDNVRLRYGTV